ncbi:MAG: hypothetical protein OXM02_03800 [Bacteroidota bacterium]|nr:hypothetical protein [Bacteroidota bacterium]MDE2833623.1 hypothetical protein [Bacteroidota bacterium]MDE2957762.1 hypothetical protein [Bacteroidota bacterium]
MDRRIVEQRKVELDGTRRLIQDSNVAIRDVYDAIVELVTNADDRYQILNEVGWIEIELIRRKAAGQPTTLRVRDYADGMTSEVMSQKIGRTGGRVSGLESGEAVRGTNSRGAKDIAALGSVVFESIASDGHLHSCRISEFFDFERYESVEVTPAERDRLGISHGTGTVVSITLNASRRIPSAANLRKNLGLLVPLRDILKDDRRHLKLNDGNRKSVAVKAPKLGGKERLKVSFDIPNYPGARAKLTIKRTGEMLEREKNRFRRGGILIKSRHAIHEATLFDKDLETDPHALRFFGRLVCDYIDELWNQFDQRVEDRAGADPKNPMPVLDPSRRSGLTREHPFVKALFSEALKRLRPLVEEERRRAEGERDSIESQSTRRRLDKLERAATKFMERWGAESDVARDLGGSGGRVYQAPGYYLSPPFAKIVAGHSILCTFRVRQKAFPEIEDGASVQIECLSQEIAADKRFASLELHPTEEDILQVSWKVTGVEPTSATAVRATVGPITAECTVEVLESQADEFKEIDRLCFDRDRYRLKLGGHRRRIQILAPITLAPAPVRVEVSVDNSRFVMHGDATMHPKKSLGVARCDLRLSVKGTKEQRGRITAQLKGQEAEAELQSVQPLGEGIKIKLEDISLGSKRYRWRQNVLEIAARHNALKRYLGPSGGFKGQDEKHFRVILAEITAGAVCAKLVGDHVSTNPEEYEGTHWDQYYDEYMRLMARFLPIAHKLQVPS